MRLLQRHPTGHGLCFTDDIREGLPPYAILSHTWGADKDEVSYQDVLQDIDKRDAGFQGPPSYEQKAEYGKLDFCLQQAAADGLQYVWIDTCCIDKRNAVELGKAINSMFQWYKQAKQCYVYLKDVSRTVQDSSNAWNVAFRASRWFTRGWTLQELIASPTISFFSVERVLLGTKTELAVQLQGITGISISALRGEDLSTFSVVDRFAWATNRTTKEPEDRVYSLIGLLDVPLAPNYGEGRESALGRLKYALAERYHGSLSSLSFTRAVQRLTSSSKQATASERILSEQIYDQLHSWDSGARRSRIRAATPRTCEWLLTHPTYVSWLDPAQLEDHHGLLWIKGNPGVGKSTIVKFADETACQRDSSDDQVVISFYFNARGTEFEKSIRGVYRSLICQLMDIAARDGTDLSNTLKSYSHIRSKIGSEQAWSMNDLESMLTTLINSATHARIMIFLDALDECDQREVQRLLEFFEDRAFEQPPVRRSQLYVCLSSRHYPSITISVGLEMILDQEPQHMNDLRQHVTRRLRVGQDDRAQRIREELIRKAKGSFIWAVLVMDIINAEYKTGRTQTLMKFLETIPDDLNQLYARIIQQDQNRMDDFNTCILWLLLAQESLMAQESLTPRMLYCAIVTANMPTCDILELEDSHGMSTQEMERFILTTSKGLAECVDETGPRPGRIVQFVHESVRGYLMEGQGFNQLFMPPFECAKCEGHMQLRDICERYLLSGANFPLRRYAAFMLVRHAEAATEHKDQSEFIRSLDFARIRAAIKSEFEEAFGEPVSTLLQYLAICNAPKLIEIAIQQGHDVDAHGIGEPTPLQLAASSSSDEALLMLLQCGADPRAATHWCTEYSWPHPLSIVTDIWYMKPRLISALLTAGADPNTVGKRRSSPLHSVCNVAWAHVDTDSELMQSMVLLLDHGAEVDDVHDDDQRGETPLLVLSRHREPVALDLARILLNRGANINVRRQPDGLTPLLIAINYRNDKFVELLLSRGADASMTDNRGRTAFDHLHEQGYDHETCRAIKRLLHDNTSNSAPRVSLLGEQA